MIPPLAAPAAAPQAMADRGFPATDHLVRAKARDLEAGFLAEMLRHAGVGAPPSAFGGGIGEEQFASFLREAQAAAITRRGGIGLAEHLFRAMKGRMDAAG